MSAMTRIVRPHKLIDDSTSDLNYLVDRADHAALVHTHYVGIDLRRRNVVMAHRFLDIAEISTLFQKPSGETMPKCMTTRLFQDTRFFDCEPDSALNLLFPNVMPLNDT